jgi:class 3 adenylate cyclase
MRTSAMRIRDGSFGQQLLLALLVAIAWLGLCLGVHDKLERLGTPNVGWMLDGLNVSPASEEASEAGLRGGGRALRINGVDLPAEQFHGRLSGGASLRESIGATNTLTLHSVHGDVRELTLTVRPWSWEDFVFTQGASDFIAWLFLVVGVVTFALRPYEIPSWALLSLCSFVSGALFTVFVPIDPTHVWNARYFVAIVGVIPYLLFHTTLAFPVVHHWLVRRSGVLWLIYGVAALQASANLAGWQLNYIGPLAYTRRIGAAVLLLSSVCFVARCAWLSVRARDRLTAQRARILLAGATLGMGPFAALQFARVMFGAFELDVRFLLWPLVLFVFALARVTVRPALLNARIAVRKAIIYTAAVGILSVLALLLVAMRPYAVAMLLFPLLYVWPRFDSRLNRILYPQRARFPELLRGVGDQLGGAISCEALLDALAAAPGTLCNATSAIAFLLPSDGSAAGVVRGVGPVRLDAGRRLEAELPVQLMVTMRHELHRVQVAIDPQYANIRDECRVGFERLGADLLLPLIRDQRVLGGLAIGPRASGDPYERAEVDALSTVAQQAVQALMRIEATERLRSREMEFADLKRFFPPQIIDQVMARGGAAQLGSQRKVVTVLFADLRGFTAFSDSVEPEEVIATLDEYHGAMGACIADVGGTLEHFAGDGLMVFFNDPVDQPDHVERAARLALAMCDEMARLRVGWSRKGYDIHVGIGIHSGYATCGFIGYEGRRDYAVIGNTTNLAARLSDQAAPGVILISARSRAELSDAFATEPVGDLTLKGFHQKQQTFRLLGWSRAAHASG